MHSFLTQHEELRGTHLVYASYIKGVLRHLRKLKSIPQAPEFVHSLKVQTFRLPFRIILTLRLVQNARRNELSRPTRRFC
jgi:hypothetical protein